MRICMGKDSHQQGEGVSIILSSWQDRERVVCRVGTKSEKFVFIIILFFHG